MKKNLFVVSFLYLSIIIISAATAQTTDSEHKSDDSKIHLKVYVDEDGKKTHFEKTYPNMDALKKDEELDLLGIDLHMTDADHIKVVHDDSSEGNQNVFIIKKGAGEPSDSSRTPIWIEKSSTNHEIHEGKNKTITITVEEEVHEHDKNESTESENKIIIDGDENYTITIKKNGSGKKMKVIVIDEDSDDDGTPCKDDTQHKEEINEEINIKVDENGEKHIEIHIKKEKSN